MKLKLGDLTKVYGPGQGGPKIDLYFDFSKDPFAELVLIQHINEIIADKLAQAPTAYSHSSDGRFWGVPDSTGQVNPDEYDLEAKIVEVKRKT